MPERQSKPAGSRFIPAALLWLGISLGTLPAAAGAVDLHRLWDDRCAQCHDHSADFSRDTLRVVDGELEGSHHAGTLRLFLANHYLSESEVEAVYAMLRAQAETPARFREECSRCHGTAAEFAREHLLIVNGVLRGRESGTESRQFLASHRGLNPEDVVFYSELLQRVTGEVHRR